MNKLKIKYLKSIQNKLKAITTKHTFRADFYNLLKELTLKTPKATFNFPIGDYQSAQKYLKGRYTRTLTLEEFTHYNRIINALLKTEEIMKGLSKPEV
ncbi:MAG: hypothetical protein GXO45_01075 [Aquificae bacterium]|nr:hypothetical protein [Aquificota bacterium]